MTGEAPAPFDERWDAAVHLLTLAEQTGDPTVIAQQTQAIEDLAMGDPEAYQAMIRQRRAAGAMINTL